MQTPLYYDKSINLPPLKVKLIFYFKPAWFPCFTAFFLFSIIIIEDFKAAKF